MSKKKKKIFQYFVPKNKTIEINFGELFGDQSVSAYNTINMQIGNKRIYSKMADVICDSNNEILALDERNKDEVLYNFLCIKKAIDDGKLSSPKPNTDPNMIQTYEKINNKSVDTFIEYLVHHLFSHKFLNIIRDYVETNYTDEISVDSELEANKKAYNEGTTFKDKHFKILYVVTCMSRFAIPLCMHYIYVNDDIGCYKDEFIFKTLKSLIKLAETGDSTDMFNKLWYYTYQSIKKTVHTNKTIWERIGIFNKTMESVNTDLVVKIINTAVPKFSFEKKIINFIKVISRETIEEYTLGAKYKFKINPIMASNDSGDDEDSLNESDLFDLQYTRQDETVRLFHKYANDQTIDVIARINNVFFDPNELEFYNKTLQMNLIQQFLVVQAFSNKFRGVKNIMSCTRDQFNKLVLILVKKMEKFGLNNLKHYLTGIRISHSQVRKPNTVLLNALYNDPVFIDLCNTKYRFVKEIFDKKSVNKDDQNPIKDNLLTIINNDYVYNHYGDENNGNLINIDMMIVKDELLRFYRLMIR